MLTTRYNGLKQSVILFFIAFYWIVWLVIPFWWLLISLLFRWNLAHAVFYIYSFLFFRFEDWSSEKSDSERRLPLENGFYSRRIRPTISAVIESFQRCFEMGSEKIKSIKRPLRIPSHVNQSALEPESGKKILNPQSQFLQRWNKIFMISCVIALAIDPLFFYIPVIDGKKKCLNVDFNLEISVCLFRTAVDFFYILHIIFQFRTGFISPSSRVFGRGELIDDPKAIAKRYLTSYFVFDVLAILPLPQVVFFTW